MIKDTLYCVHRTPGLVLDPVGMIVFANVVRMFVVQGRRRCAGDE
jgi:hypothetical protein